MRLCTASCFAKGDYVTRPPARTLVGHPELVGAGQVVQPPLADSLHGYLYLVRFGAGELLYVPESELVSCPFLPYPHHVERTL